MSGHKKWSRLEEAEDIIDHVYSILAKLPLADLRKEQMWIPSKELVEEIVESKDRMCRYMKRNKVNGWRDEHNPPA